MRPWAAFVPAVVAALLGTGVAPAAATADDTVLHDVRVTDIGPGPTGGYRYTQLVVELDLSDPDGLPDVLMDRGLSAVVVLGRLAPDGSVATVPSDRLPDAVEWLSATRVAGTATDGTWRGEAVVSSAWTGTLTIEAVFVDGGGGNDVVRLEPPRPAVVAMPTWAATDPWLYRPATVVRVTTGRETWRPRVVLTTRDGTPVAGASTFAEGPALDDPARQLWEPRYFEHTLPPGAFPLRSDAAGVVTLPGTYPVGRHPQLASLGGYGVGGRYYALMARGVALPMVKWQASGSFAAGPGEVVTLTGNAFPAPVVYRAANPNVHLQRLVGRTWRTEATGRVRDNGRFTVAWDALDAAGYWVRVYKPGGTDANGWSEGTAGPPVWVATP